MRTILATMKHGVRLAVGAAGSTRKLARLLGISGQAVAKWDQVPAHQIIAVERVTGVPREVLRPDLYRERGSERTPCAHIDQGPS